jgi:alginate O-acetyltransferase complex protein AlgI
MVVADNIAGYVNTYWRYGASDNMAAAVPLSLTLLFSCQIFSDFLGYSRIAMGSAYLLGFKLPGNFNHPYIAASFREFWTRWHITLSTWIRDYLYIPLGGNQGSEIKVYSTLMITFLLAGLWHGAAFTFILWGGIHGLALLVERIFRSHGLVDSKSIPAQIIWFLVVQATVLFSWVFFRSTTLEQAFHFLNNFFNGGFNPSYASLFLPAFWFVLPVLLLHGRGFLSERGWLPTPGAVEKGVVSALMLYGLFTLYGKTNAFLYFQF